MTTTWLIDKSAIGRLHASPDAETWTDRIGRGLVRISTVTRLEVGFSARTGADHRALAVQSALAERRLHRAPSIPDLLIAANAELADLTVLHVDKDFELIAEVTGQPVERLAMGPVGE